ncbi:hypothetical protein KAF25_000825 [Fusarium avenaceum]|uniref:Uncharacterized protein n=1 Tax=Fusarium avenaceum TaxID=40199 RepID=A0A9P7KPE9_9HYPO|nr:hypothetical protein KAF25_000825 [Fusarium avenaceum]
MVIRSLQYEAAHGPLVPRASHNRRHESLAAQQPHDDEHRNSRLQKRDSSFKFDTMAVFGSFRKWLSLKQYQLEVTFSVYMFTPWEKFFFSSIVFLLFSLTFIAACLYLPHHISFLVGRAWYYINGEHIDVAEVVQEAVKDMSASALSGATSSAVDVTKETVETIVREL